MKRYEITARSASGFGGVYETSRKPRSSKELLKYAESDGYVSVADMKTGKELCKISYTPESGGKWYRVYLG